METCQRREEVWWDKELRCQWQNARIYMAPSLEAEAFEMMNVLLCSMKPWKWISMKKIERIFHQVTLPFHDFKILLYVISDRCPSGNSQTVLGRNLNHDLQHQTYHEMLYKVMIFWYHSLFAFCCFIVGVVGFAGRGDHLKRFEYPCLTPTVVTSSQLQYFSILQLIEHYDVKIFLILPLFDSIAATFLSDPDPSNTTGSNQSPPILGRWSH